jgi:hypothetical protein
VSIDLFGPVPPQQIAACGSRKGIGAYAAMPGSGPEGKRCKDCANAYPKRWQRVYWKCKLVVADEHHQGENGIHKMRRRPWVAKHGLSDLRLLTITMDLFVRDLP